MGRGSGQKALIRLAAAAALGAGVLVVLLPFTFLLAFGRPPGDAPDARSAALGAALGAIVALARLRVGYAAALGFVATAALLSYRGWVYLASAEFAAMARLILAAALAGAAAAAVCALLLPHWFRAEEPAGAQSAPTRSRPR